MLRMILAAIDIVLGRFRHLKRYLNRRFDSIDAQLAANHMLLVSIDEALHPEREQQRLQAQIDAMASGLGTVGDTLDSLQEK
jgi:hypothetical protein